MVYIVGTGVVAHAVLSVPKLLVLALLARRATAVRWVLVRRGLPM